MNNDNHIQALLKKIDILNEEAWACRLEDSEKSYLLSLEALKLSQEHDYTPGLAHASLVKGYCHIRRSENMEAIEELSASLYLFEKLNDTKGRAEAYEFLAVAKRNLGDIENSLSLSFKALGIVREISHDQKIASNHYQIGVTYKRLGNFDKALEYLYKSLEQAKVLKNDLYQSYAINIIGTIHFENGDYEQALDHFTQSLAIRHQFGDKWGEAGSLDNMGYCYLKLGQLEKANEYIQKSLTINQTISDKRGHANVLMHLAELYRAMGESSRAQDHAAKSLSLRESYGDRRGVAEVLLLQAAIASDQTSMDSKPVLPYLQEALAIAGDINAIDLVSKARYQLYRHYAAAGNYQEAIQQLESHHALETAIHKNAVAQKIVSLEIAQKAEESEREAIVQREQNAVLTRLNQQIQEQKSKLEKTLTELKATQAQLIQAEKMASLGELTAGIAHEIQNPLNFVNNFSEINVELIQEANEAIDEGDIAEAKAILHDLNDNEQKINHHGKRADMIVKGMLQHSRTSSGQKELTDINALCDEYLRLAYNGMKAKNESFDANINKNLDDGIGNMLIIPQDIGRVLLNLMNNAFYAVNEKAQTNIEGYIPSIFLTSKRTKSGVEVSIKDNGSGIPDAIKDKIFQPFFTTKPTGSGTGLGLSLAYDIVKAHGGELQVASEFGQGSTFTMHLPDLKTMEGDV